MRATILVSYNILVTRGIFPTFEKILLVHYGVRTFMLMCFPLILDYLLVMAVNLDFDGIIGLMELCLKKFSQEFLLFP